MTFADLEVVRRGVLAYLSARYSGDLSWHPLFCAVREWYVIEVGKRGSIYRK